MSDDRLRRHERARTTGGGLAEEVAWLRERLRAGLVANDRIELAARLGHSPSREIFGGRRFAPVRPNELFERWGLEAVVRVALALAERARTRFPQGDPEEAGLEALLSVTRRWCAAPGAGNVPDEDMSGRGYMAAHERCASNPLRFYPMQMAAMACHAITLGGGFALEPFVGWCNRIGVDLKQRRSALVADVVPWVLGIGDPLAGRIESEALAIDELKARWSRSRDPADGAVYLRARARAGDLAPARIRFAAGLGDAACKLVQGVGEPGSDLRALACDVDREVRCRLGIALARFATRVLFEKQAAAAVASEALAASDAWREDPTEERRRAIADTWRGLRGLDWGAAPSDGQLALRAMVEALRWSAAPLEQTSPIELPEVDEDDSTAGADGGDYDGGANDELLRKVRLLLRRHQLAERPLALGREERLALDRSSIAAVVNAFGFARDALEARGRCKVDAEAELMAAMRTEVVPWALLGARVIDDRSGEAR